MDNQKVSNSVFSVSSYILVLRLSFLTTVAQFAFLFIELEYLTEDGKGSKEAITKKKECKAFYNSSIKSLLTTTGCSLAIALIPLKLWR